MFMELLAACCGEEDRRKIEYIYLHYGKTIFYIIHKKVSSQSDAEDLTHDLFVRLIQIADRIDVSNPYKLKSFLVILAKHAAIDFVRKGKRTPLGDSGHEEMMEAAAIEINGSPVDYVLGNECYEVLLSCIERLGEREKMIFQLKYIHGYGNAEIAELLGISSAREVSDSLYRGKRMLMKMIGGDRYFENG